MKRIGVQYYRPPHPRPEYWEKDLQTLKAYGITCIRLWVYWRTTEVNKGAFVWSDYDQVLDLASRSGLDVILQLVPECQPQWFLEENRSLWPKAKDGSANPCLGNGMCAVGSYPGILFDQPVFLAESQRFMAAAVSHFAPHPAVSAWDPFNEIMPHSGYFSFDEVTEKRWQNWVERKFHTIEKFNAESAMHFQRFDQLPLFDGRDASNHVPGWLILRFYEFLAERSVEELRRRVGIIRSYDFAHPIYGHTHSSISNTNNDWYLSREVDCWGTSQYCTEHVSGVGRDYLAAALEYSSVRSSAPGGTWWLAEHSGGQTYYLYGHFQPSPSDVRAHLILASAFGAESAFFWQYRAESFGQESPGWGLLPFDGQPDGQMDSVAEMAEIFSSQPALFEKAEFRAPVTILYDRRTSQYESAAKSWVQPSVSAQEEMTGWFEAAYSAGSHADLQRIEGLETDGVPQGCQIYVLPMHLQCSSLGYQHLLDWVQEGGRLIITPYSAHFDDRARLCDSIPGSVLADAMAVKVRRRHFESQITCDSTDYSIGGHWLIEELRIGDDVEVLLTANARPLLLRRKYGLGEIFYFTSLVGTAFTKQQGDLSAWLRHTLRVSGSPAIVDLGQDGAPHSILARHSLTPEGITIYLVNGERVDRKITLDFTPFPSGVLESITPHTSSECIADATYRINAPARDGLILFYRYH